jgi:hypothetical protein
MQKQGIFSNAYRKQDFTTCSARYKKSNLKIILNECEQFFL